MLRQRDANWFLVEIEIGNRATCGIVTTVLRVDTPRKARLFADTSNGFDEGPPADALNTMRPDIPFEIAVAALGYESPLKSLFPVATNSWESSRRAWLYMPEGTVPGPLAVKVTVVTREARPRKTNYTISGRVTAKGEFAFG